MEPAGEGGVAGLSGWAVKACRSLLTLCLACSLPGPLPALQGTTVRNATGGIPLAPGTSQGSQDLPASSSPLIVSAWGLMEDGWEAGWQNEGDMKTLLSSPWTWQRGAIRGEGRQRKAMSLPLEPGYPVQPSEGAGGELCISERQEYPCPQGQGVHTPLGSYLLCVRVL